VTAVATMRHCAIGRLHLYHFRNYDDTTVHFGPGLNVIFGDNAQGKTNLLEAVATLTLTRSPRTSTSGDLLRWGSTQCAVEAEVARPTSDCVLSMRFERDTVDDKVRRAVRVDGKPRPARAVLGLCPVVLFWPEDLQLVKAGPEGRRRLLDVLLSQLDPRAAVHLLRYRRVLEQRNALLHRLRADGRGGDALPGFTHELAHHGARVVVARAKLVSDLAPLAAEALRDLSSGNERLNLRYSPSFETSGEDDERVETELRSALQARASEELARGVTVLGPHRDDIEILLDGRAARSAASQGQQRSIVLACKLAEMRHVAACTGMGPVVLLDDVLSELDAHRRADLLTMLAAGTSHQVLVTATEALSDIRPFVSGHSFEVTAGAVREVT
jgi:DNA replication and repair protein RecF